MNREARWLGPQVRRGVIRLMTGLLLIAGAGIAAATSAFAAPAAPARAGVQHTVTTKYGTVAYGWRPVTATVKPNSAHSCDVDVCMQITGHSNFVDDWDTQAYWDGAYICTRAKFLLNSIVVLLGQVYCGGGGGPVIFYYDWVPNKYFPAPSLAGNQWTGIPGFPRVSITK
jgi:hypothetical protein